jgi:hypothetical protein
MSHTDCFQKLNGFLNELESQRSYYVLSFIIEHLRDLQITVRSRGSSGSVVTDYGLDDRGSIPDRDEKCFF